MMPHSGALNDNFFDEVVFLCMIVAYSDIEQAAATVRLFVMARYNVYINTLR